MRKIGYARVSAQHQNLDRQLGVLVTEGCAPIFQEKASGRSTLGRPQLEKAIVALGTGDVLVLPEWDRATRSMLDGIQIIQRVAARGALVKVLDKPHLDLTSTMGQGILAFLSALALDERERIVKRAQDGRKAARARGVQFGPSISWRRAAGGSRPGSRQGPLPGILIAITPSSRGCAWLRSEGDLGDCQSSRPMSVIPPRAATTALQAAGSVKCQELA